MKYQCSLKVERENITPTFIEGELPTFTKGRDIRITPTFTESELPKFTEGRKKS